MHKVPIVAYSEDGLSLIATQIGTPIMLDAFTSSMCVDSWGRIGFARALIERLVSKPLVIQRKRYVLSMNGSHRFVTIVIFLAIQLINVQNVLLPKPAMDVADDGFTIVVRLNVDVVHLMVLSQSSQALHAEVFHKATNKTMFCSFIYADFNVALNMDDIYAGSSSFNSFMCEFKDYVTRIEVMDINSSGLH
nr:hypothetical protein [Tanacetum cinerariifolium]